MFPKGSEWILILVVVLLLFGARKLPELARSLGASAKEFRKGIQEGSQEEKVESPEPTTMSTEEPAPPSSHTPPKST
jgi:sec-independent protein translocase protein TatA